jgi:hypothetical protein
MKRFKCGRYCFEVTVGQLTLWRWLLSKLPTWGYLVPYIGLCYLAEWLWPAEFRGWWNWTALGICAGISVVTYAVWRIIWRFR